MFSIVKENVEKVFFCLFNKTYYFICDDKKKFNEIAKQLEFLLDSYQLNNKEQNEKEILLLLLFKLLEKNLEIELIQEKVILKSKIESMLAIM